MQSAWMLKIIGNDAVGVRERVLAVLYLEFCRSSFLLVRQHVLRHFLAGRKAGDLLAAELGKRKSRVTSHWVPVVEGSLLSWLRRLGASDVP